MKTGIIFMAIISALLSSAPRELSSLVREDVEVSISEAARPELEINGSRVKGAVFTLKSDSDKVEQEFLEFNAAAGFSFSGTKRDLMLFRRGSVNRTAALIRKECGAIAVCLDSEIDLPSLQRPTAVDTGGISPPPGSRCAFSMKGKSGSFQSVYQCGSSTAPLFEHFGSQFSGNGWSVMLSGHADSGNGYYICARGQEWCFVSFSSGTCVFSYCAEGRKYAK